jgi:N-acetylglutamate synthase-like GNAT family acetyltransferase
MTSGFALRVADLRDLAAVGALLEASYPTLLAEGYEPTILAKALPLIVKANPKLLASGTYYVAETAEGELIACGGWTKERPGSGGGVEGEAHIRHFATHPDWIRRGAASGLLRCCIQDATAAGIAAFECYSTLVAVAFYQASGFVAVRPIDLELMPGVSFPGLLMRRQLP